MWLGVDYYPEQWDPSRMDEDMDTVRELGGNVIRIAEFSWHLMEKNEGEYDFSFFDGVIRKAKAHGLSVILGTPTASIPAWLAKKHPSILPVFENGQRCAFGGRRTYCYNAPAMYAYSEKILTKLVEHYREEEAIIAWQIDNEIAHEGSDVCFCPECQKAFRAFLRTKFRGDIDALNATYGTTFWSQEYNSFDEIPLPTATITTHNPALRLDWERFRKKSIVDFMNFQIRTVREIAPNARIMHDFSGGGLQKRTDFSEIALALDVVGYNNYPVWGGQREPVAPHVTAFNLDYIRGLKQKNFWITEAIMGAQGHDVIGYTPRPDQAKMWSYQGFAHGCDSILYFRYRGGTKGAEQFCYGVLDADNIKRRKFYEVQRAFADLAQYAKAMEAPIRARVALVYDYDSLAAFRIQRQSFLLDLPAEMQKYYKMFYDRNIPVDVLPARADFSGYDILILPHILLHDPAFVEKTKAFCTRGGSLLLTYRTSTKDKDNNLVFGERVPLGYSDFAGVTVAECESLQEGQEIPLIPLAGNVGGKGGVFREFLEVSDAEVLYRYGDPFYTESPAITVKAQGAGKVYYVGCSPEENILRALCDRMIADHGIETVDTPAGVETALRGEGEAQVRMWMNHNPYPVDFDGVHLDPYESRIEKVASACDRFSEKMAFSR